MDAALLASFCGGTEASSQTTAARTLPSDLAVMEGLPTSAEVHGLRLDSFLRQHLLRTERRRAVGSFMLLLWGG